MIIHLVGSMRKFEEDIPYMQIIADTVTEQNGLIALNWFRAATDRNKRIPEKALQLDWEQQIIENEDAIVRSNAVIIEGSRFNFSQGYQTALALQQNKPVLNLYRKELTEYREWPDKYFVSGVSSHSLFTSKAYKNEEELRRIVTTFLHNHTHNTHELELKLTLDDTTYKEIEGLSQSSGMNKVKIIQDLISRNIQEK
jgi:hypothetical protein